MRFLTLNQPSLILESETLCFYASIMLSNLQVSFHLISHDHSMRHVTSASTVLIRKLRLTETNALSGRSEFLQLFHLLAIRL